MTIFLDMDGVCVDFVSAALKLFNSPLQYSQVNIWEMEKLMDISLDYFWEKVNEAGEHFWVDLKPYSWFQELYDICYCKSEVIFLSSPGRSPTAASGKIKWLHNQFGPDYTRYILTEWKLHVGGAGDILIDDRESYCSRWGHGDRNAILFPAPWNPLREHAHNPIPYICQQLELV